MSEELFKLLKCYNCNSHTPPSYTHLCITLTLDNDALMSRYINLSMNIYEYTIQKDYLTVDFIFLSVQWISYDTWWIHASLWLF